jgi:hypothetical protein
MKGRNGWTDHDVRSFRGRKSYGTGLHDKVGQDHDVCQRHAVVCLDVRGQLIGKGVATWRENLSRPPRTRRSGASVQVGGMQSNGRSRSGGRSCAARGTGQEMTSEHRHVSEDSASVDGRNGALVRDARSHRAFVQGVWHRTRPHEFVGLVAACRVTCRVQMYPRHFSD